MLTEFGIRNFKAFGDALQSVPLSRITLVYGPNSGGKSSIIQAMLLLKQSAEHFESLPPQQRQEGKREITPKGDYVDLGSFPALVHKHDTTRTLDVALTFRPVDPQPVNAEYRIQASFLADNSSDERDSSYLARVEYSIRQSNLNLSMRRRGNGLRDLVPDMMRTRGGYDHSDDPIFDYDITLEYDPEEVLSDQRRSKSSWRMNHISIHWDRIGLEKRTYDVPLNMGRIGTNDIPVMASGTFAYFPSPEVIGRRRSSRRTRSAQDIQNQASVRAWNVASRLQVEKNELSTISERTLKSQFAREASDAVLPFDIRSQGGALLDRITYLGPLRSPPQRTYVVSGGNRSSTGIHGQYMSHVLYRDDATLERVNEWFSRLGLQYRLAVSQLSSQVELIGEQAALTLLDQSGIEVTLVDVGFGINQVLPVIIEGVCSPPGSVICVEQPEIHLHPRLQAELADMVIATAKEGKQWLIETHSEMLIRQIQARIADPYDDLRVEDVTVLYVEPDTGDSTIRHLRMDHTGEFEDPWPHGFFDEATRKMLEIMRLKRMA